MSRSNLFIEQPLNENKTIAKENNRLYLIYSPSSANRIELSMPFIPDSLSYSYNAEFSSQSLLGRKSPIFLYSKGSKKAYSFSLFINEDLLDTVIVSKTGSRKRPVDIVEFIDYIKMLSYPVSDPLNGISFPRVFFQLGNIAGEGIVNTSITWQKPFIKGRYFTVSISFDITIERDIDMPKLTYVTQFGETANSIIEDYTSRVNLSEDGFNDMTKYLADKGYSVSLNNFLALSNGSDMLQSIKQMAAVENFDYQAQRLSKIYAQFAQASGVEQITDLAFLKAFKDANFDYKTLYTKDTKDAKQIRDAKKAFKKYLDYYYDNINTTMTRAEYDAVINDVYTVLENLQIYAEEIYGYAKGN